MTAQVETDINPAQSLKEQILKERAEQGEKKEVLDAFQKQEADEVHVREDARDGEQVGEGSEGQEEAVSGQEEKEVNRFKFQKGDDSYEVDEDAIIKIKADGKTRDVTLKELRDYAAGGFAVRNRMRELSEEKKKLHDPFVKFSENSKKDALGTLKKVFYAIKEVDPNADYKGFLKELGNQVQQQAKMSPAERKAYELQRDLEDKNEKLTKSELNAKVQKLEYELQETYDLTQEQIQQYGSEIMSNPELASTVRSEDDLFDRISELADEVDRQKASYDALRSFQSTIKPRDPLVFELSRVLRENPDFDSDDLKEVAETVLSNVERSKASQKLSRKQRSRAIVRRDRNQPDYSKMKPADVLKHKLLEERKNQSKR